MSISVICDCGKQVRVKDEAAGKKYKCPVCGSVVAIPIPQPENDEASNSPYHVMEFGDADQPPPPVTTVAPASPPQITFSESSSSRVTEREPWYYRFLETYADVNIWLTHCIAVVVLIAVFYIFMFRLYAETRASTEEQLIKGFVVLVFTGIMVVLFIEIPMLFAMAFIHLAVDAGPRPARINR